MLCHRGTVRDAVRIRNRHSYRRSLDACKKTAYNLICFLPQALRLLGSTSQQAHTDGGCFEVTSAIAVLFLILAVASVAVIALAAAGVLHRNRVVGIRTSVTLSSDDAWRRGHRAGLLPASIGSILSATFALVGLMVAGFSGTEMLAEVMVGCSIAAILVGGVWSTIRAGHATGS